MDSDRDQIGFNVGRSHMKSYSHSDVRYKTSKPCLYLKETHRFFPQKQKKMYFLQLKGATSKKWPELEGSSINIKGSVSPE